MSKRKTSTREGLDNRNDNNDFNEPQDILEDVDSDNNDDDNEFDSVSFEHRISAVKYYTFCNIHFYCLITTS